MRAREHEEGNARGCRRSDDDGRPGPRWSRPATQAAIMTSFNTGPWPRVVSGHEDDCSRQAASRSMTAIAAVFMVFTTLSFRERRL